MKFLVLPVLVAMLLVGCGGGGGGSAEDRRPKKVVEVKPVTMGYLSLYRPVSGVLKPVNDSLVSAQASGDIALLNVNEGEWAEEGEVVVTLDDSILKQQMELARAGYDQAEAAYKLALDPFREEDILQARAALEASKAAHEVAEADYTRSEELYNEGVISRQQYDHAKQALEGANAQLVAARETINKMEEGPRQEEIEAAAAALASAEAGLRLAEENHANAFIQSPFAGIVAEIFVDPGELVAPGMPIFRVVDPSELLIETSLSDIELAGLNEGDEVEVTVDALVGQPFAGTLSYLAPAADSVSHVFKAEISIANVDGILKPGMVAHAKLERNNADLRLLVPVEALLTEEGQRYVYVVEKGDGEDVGKTIKRRVSVLNFSSEYAEVVSGVDEGECVVIRGLRGLIEGEEVEFYSCE